MKLKILAAAVGFALATPAFAITAFATFSPDNSTPNIEFNGTGAGAGTLTSTAQPVTFRFLDSLGLGNTPFSASLGLNVTTANGFVANGIGVLPISSGLITFTSLAPVTFNGRTGNNLLTVNFSGGAVTGLIGGSVASLFDSDPPRTVTFTSDFLDFTQTTARDLSLAITAINPLLEASSVFGGVANFSGTAAGSFGAEGPIGIPGGVPEPGAWMLMIAGFGLVGTTMRRRSRMATVAA